MSLLPPFEDFDATASWVSSTAAQPKFMDSDFQCFASGTPPGQPMGDSELEALFGIKFPSPQLPEASVFDTGLSSVPAPPQAALQGALASVSGHSTCSPLNPNHSTSIHHTTDKGPNALQLDMLDALTPAGSPRAISSGFDSPSFQFSPTPTLTMCPTVDSTPAPRSNSRCSSRSSFSTQTDDVKPFMSRTVSDGYAEVQQPVIHIGPDGKPKKLHLCPYVECPRSARTFRSNADLQRHVRSHRGERPYKCPEPDCGKAYGQQNKMVNHVKQQHPALLSSIEVGRSRRRAPASAPVSRAVSVSRASSVMRSVSAPSTPGGSRIRGPVGTPITSPVASIGPSRFSSSTSGRPAPYTLPTTSTTAAAHLARSSQGLTIPSARRDSLSNHMQLHHEVFGPSSSTSSSSSSLWG